MHHGSPLVGHARIGEWTARSFISPGEWKIVPFPDLTGRNHEARNTLVFLAVVIVGYGTSPLAMAKTPGTLATASATAPRISIVPTYRPEPRYPFNALDRGVRGCVRIAFRLDKNDRPTHLQAVYSVPEGFFARPAIEAIAKWRFRVTNLRTGKPATDTHTTINQVIAFGGSSDGWRAPRINSLLRWICEQPRPRTLIVTPAAATAPLRISSRNQGQRVDIVQLPTTRHRALKDGWVSIGFCIDKNGQVAHARVLKSSPGKLYDRAALAALESWPFTRRTTFGTPAKTCEIHSLIKVVGTAALEAGPVVLTEKPIAFRVQDLSLPGNDRTTHGLVTTSFCVGKDGKVSDARTVTSKPAGVFDAAAIRILHAWSYWPKMVDGRSVRTCNVEQSIAFKVGHDRLVWAYPGNS